MDRPDCELPGRHRCRRWRLVIAHRRAAVVRFRRPQILDAERPPTAAESALDVLVDCQLSELVVAGLHWLARAQNADGGWGDCPGRRFHAGGHRFSSSGIPSDRSSGELCRPDGSRRSVCRNPRRSHRAASQQYRRSRMDGGGFSHRRLRGDRSLAKGANVCIRRIGLPLALVAAVSFAVVAASSNGDLAAVQTAVQLAKQHFKPSRNPVRLLLGQKSLAASLAALQELQASDGSISASPVSTAVVVLCLAGIGQQDSLIVERGVEYLLSAVRGDASWPVVEDLSIRNSALVVNRIAAGSEDMTDDEAPQELHKPSKVDCVEWILTNQHLDEATCPQGGWAWSDAPGAFANVVDTAGVLCALRALSFQYAARPVASIADRR